MMGGGSEDGVTNIKVEITSGLREDFGTNKNDVRFVEVQKCFFHRSCNVCEAGFDGGGGV